MCRCFFFDNACHQISSKFPNLCLVRIYMQLPRDLKMISNSLPLLNYPFNGAFNVQFFQGFIFTPYQTHWYKDIQLRFLKVKTLLNNAFNCSQLFCTSASLFPSVYFLFSAFCIGKKISARNMQGSVLLGVALMFMACFGK